MNLQWFRDLPFDITAVSIAAVAAVAAIFAIMTARSAAASAKRAQLHRPVHPAPSPDVHNLRAEVQRLERQFDQFRSELAHVTSLVYSVHNAPPAAPAPEIVAPAWPSEAPADPVARPVEYDGVDLRLSRSLSALGSLVASRDPDGQANLFLNEKIQIDHVAFERWSHLFEFRGGGAYARYRTVNPALVEWNEGAGTGKLVSRGLAEVAP
jgi:hypothetical protein